MAVRKENNKKSKRVIPLRTPGDFVEKPSARPSKLLFDEVAKQIALEENQDQTQTPPRPEVDQTQTRSKTKPKDRATIIATKVGAGPTAPMSDFNKRANSIDRDALPSGVFPGASKKIYDALYLRTRGSITPTRSIQATRRELLAWSGVQNIKTINAHLKRLKDAGLLKITNFVGEQSGSIYEVYLPEEIDLTPDPDQTQTTQTIPRPAPKPHQTQKTDSDQTQKTVWVGSGKTTKNKDTYGEAKTFFKTLNLSDDDAAHVLETFDMINQAARSATGRDLSRKDFKAFREIIEMIIDETTIAGTRAQSISVYLKFAAENLRRRLYKKTQPTGQSLHRSEKSKPFEPGKPAVVASGEASLDIRNHPPDDFVVEPLGERRYAMLENLRRTTQINGREAIEVYRENFTAEDWSWLTENLK